MALTTKNTLRKAGISISIIIILFFFLIPFLLHDETKLLSLLISIILFSISIISPNSLRIPYEIWIKIGNKLGSINSKAVLFIFFYILITPVSLLRRVNMLIFQKKKVKTFYINNSKTTTKSTFKDQF